MSQLTSGSIHYFLSSDINTKYCKKCGKIKAWDTMTTQLILEMLAHHTPPSCVVPNILSAAEIVLPNVNIIQAYPAYSLCAVVAVFSFMSPKLLHHIKLVKQTLTKNSSLMELANVNLQSKI